MESPSSAAQVAVESNNVSPMSSEDSISREPPRLLITKMELENFKSYAGVKTIGPFHKCFSAVVGPNGSGKSNVIDAMLFVFGKRAKKLRLNKVSELIHRSTAFPDATSARVSVYFQEIIDTGPGDDDYELVPNTETVVTRVARKDNGSTYKIDGRNCQFKDVAAYLGAKGIDLDNNRFLILQGEVEMISMMSPKGKNEGDEGLLEYLEDIIGSSKFVEETDAAAEAVEVLTEQRQEKLNRVKAVEKEKDALEGAKQEAEQLLSKEREIRRKKNILYQMHVMKASMEMEKYTEKATSAQTRLTEEREQMESSNSREAELLDGLQKQQSDYDNIFAELTTTKEEFAAYERRDIKLREEIKHAKAQKKKLDAKVKAQTKKEEECTEKATEAEESIPQLEEKIIQLTDNKTECDAQLDVVNEETMGKTQELRAELDTATQKLAPVNQERAVFQANLDTAETKVRLLEDRVSTASERLQKSEEELASIDEQQDSKRQALASAENEIVVSKERFKEAESEVKKYEEKENKLAKRYAQLMARSEEAKVQLQSKGGSRSSPAVQSILKAAQKGGELANVGVVGRLGDLATISDEYDVAISTACGSLDNLVILTTAGAQKCLMFLRKHSLGRAKFMPLDKLPKGAHDRQVSTPENAPRLFELLSPATQSVVPALYMAVSDTLVAPDLDTATRWAFDFGKRWRVVTVDGNLVESSGTMSGGGTSVRKGGMKLASGRKKTPVDDEDDTLSTDHKELEQEAEKAQQMRSKCRAKCKELQDEIRALKKKIKSLESKIPQLSIEIGGCDTTRAELTKFIPELRTQCVLSKDEGTELKSHKQEASKCKSDMSACALEAAKLESEVGKIQKAIMDAGGSKLKKHQEACDDALTDLNGAEKFLNQTKVVLSSMKKATTKAFKAKEISEKELESCSIKLEKLKTDFQSLEKDAYDVLQSFETMKEKESIARESLDAASIECEKIKETMSEFKCLEVELLAQIDENRALTKDAERKRAKYESDISKLVSEFEDDDDFDESDDESSDDEDDDVAIPATDEDGDVNMDADKMTDSNENTTEDASMTKKISKKQRASQLPRFTFDDLKNHSRDGLLNDIAMLESEKNAIAKYANMGAIAEYRKKESDYLSRVYDLDAMTDERNSARQTHEDLRRRRLEMFMDGFGQITLKLKEMYQMITLGGDAELELVDSLDPFSEGIIFSVRPPKKSWKNISNLSGGEKTLSSLALVFALHHFRPTPLYVMDEIDAALDFKNVSIVANYIKERTRNAQFIIISLRNNMFELADRLVGIYKTDNCTKSVSINPRAYGVQSQQDGHVPGTPGVGLSERKRNIVPSEHQSALKGSRRLVEFTKEPQAVSTPLVED